MAAEEKGGDNRAHRAHAGRRMRAAVIGRPPYLGEVWRDHKKSPPPRDTHILSLFLSTLYTTPFCYLIKGKEEALAREDPG